MRHVRRDVGVRSGYPCTVCGKAIRPENLPRAVAPPQKPGWMANGMSDIAPFARLMAACIASEIAAVILEPIVRARAGCAYIIRYQWLRRIRNMCDREGILLIADEIKPPGLAAYRQTVRPLRARRDRAGYSAVPGKALTGK
ncbi:aminotransferase class III-fold pyridoxal phosphate-dependent enzyme [Salmonella enterica subsp. enterica]|nr:aminotransferase class III-fold pyridoxal phosphate-dependent enzyme [Salmonella enterica subsp. enterica]